MTISIRPKAVETFYDSSPKNRMACAEDISVQIISFTNRISTNQKPTNIFGDDDELDIYGNFNFEQQKILRPFSKIKSQPLLSYSTQPGDVSK